MISIWTRSRVFYGLLENQFLMNLERKEGEVIAIKNDNLEQGPKW